VTKFGMVRQVGDVRVPRV